jgi:hypothetical protein
MRHVDRRDCKRDRLVLDGVGNRRVAFVIFLWKFVSIPPALDTELNKKLVVTYFQSGSIAAIASATGLFWTGLATVAVAFVIFLWKFVSIPPALDTELNKKIASLESKPANLEQPPPDYALPYRRAC